MDTQENVQQLKAIYEAFGRGDIPFILDRIDSRAQFVSHFDPLVPWGGDFTGHVQDFFRAIDESVDVLGFEPGEFIAQGDSVVSLGTFACRSKATGKAAKTKWAFVWKFKDGRIVSYEQFHDPAIAEIFRN